MLVNNENNNYDAAAAVDAVFVVSGDKQTHRVSNENEYTHVRTRTRTH